ncbi:MAG: ATP-grasp domain-containing protein [Acidobacteriota bacterium]
MTDRKRALASVSASLGRRDLIWAGLRADDIEAISDLDHVAGGFSIVGGHDRGGAVPSLADYEDMSGVRPDLDSWDIEDHLDAPASHEFREAILRRLSSDTALLPYRPSSFLSSLLFARRDRCLDLGMFGPHQALFEHKPWVETHVALMGLPHVKWDYVADEEQFVALRMLREGPIVLRVSRSSGGAGLVRVEEPEGVTTNWPHRPEAFIGVSRFLEAATPVNIGATVWHNGVTMHRPSVQLIGISGCTSRPFGYCGNDFGAVAELEERIIGSIEESVTALGKWLRGFNYRGTFGVDFLVHNGCALFTEVNPRFQGSTHASSQLSSEAGESCLFLDHVAAVLGHDAPKVRPLRELVRETPAFAHLVVHSTSAPAYIDGMRLGQLFRRHPLTCRVDVSAKPRVRTETGGVVARVTARDRMTDDGFDLLPSWSAIVNQWLRVACG